MKTIVTLLVYNRLQNLRRWIEAWEKCESDTELVVIHNCDFNGSDYQSLCREHGIKYIPRENKGFDIGAMQDVFAERLDGFDNDWDYLIWVSDDTIPMKKDFVSIFLGKMKQGVGISCIEISDENQTHIRTSGFCIGKELSKKLVFPASPITTKMQCWEFEHRGTNTFLHQVKKNGLTAVQLHPDVSEVLWDTDHRAYYNNIENHYRIFHELSIEDGPSDKTVVVIMVYNRFNNLQQWVRCWKMAERANSDFVVIHNCEPGVDNKYRDFCMQNGIKYIRRNNVGLDMGAFQDVCRERLPGFNNAWDYLIWIADDSMPMKRNFVSIFVNQLRESSVGVVCPEISSFYKVHVRTNAFAVKKSLANTLTFPADPITTHKECYAFEHLSQNTLLDQVTRMGLRCIQADNDPTAVLWDTGHRGDKKNMADFLAVFPTGDDPGMLPMGGTKVLFISMIYNTYPHIISSLLAQTHPNWILLLVHDGPNVTGLADQIRAYNDKRIIYLETEHRLGRWGHEWRRWAMDEIKAGKMASDCDFIVNTNADNYYTPVFCEYMVAGFNEKILATYCSQMVHSYVHWKVMDTRLERGFIDAGAVMVRKSPACEIGWQRTKSHSADWYYFNSIIIRYGLDTFKKVEGCLFVHN